jgi:hypothetical protein
MVLSCSAASMSLMFGIEAISDRHQVVVLLMAGEDQHRRHESDHQSIRRLASGFRHLDPCGSQVGEGIPNPSERLSSAERLHHRAHLQQPIGVGEERSRGGRLRTEDSWQEISAFRTECRA